MRVQPHPRFWQIADPAVEHIKFPPLQTKANERKQSIFYQYVDTIALEDERLEGARRHLITYQRAERHSSLCMCV